MGPGTPVGPPTITIRPTGPGTNSIDPHNPDSFPWDNSNSQYGLMGVYLGAEAGVEVPTAYWKAAQKHWTDCQLEGGQWAYRAGDRPGYFSMTCAGTASLLVTHDWVDAADARRAIAATPMPAQLLSGLAWLEANDNCVKGPDHPHALRRVRPVRRSSGSALISGFRYFGRHDWYAELAERLVRGPVPQRRVGPDGRDGGHGRSRRRTSCCSSPAGGTR